MRIVAFVHYYVPSRNAGSETMLHAALRYLLMCGHSVEVYATRIENKGVSYDIDGIRVHSLALPDAMKCLETDPPDVVIAQHENSLSVAKLRRLGSLKRTKYVYVMHNDYPRALKQRDSSVPDLVVYNTKWIQRKHGNHRKYRETVVRPPVEVSKHATKPGDKVTLVNLSKDKGGGFLIELASRMPDVQFLGVEGGYGDQIYSRDCPDNLEYVPHTTDMKTDVWARTKVLLVPSRYESFGMVGMEAMASGIPVVASPTEGLIESLSYAGNFAPYEDIDAWEQAIRSVLKGWQSHSRIAKERIRQFDVFEDEMKSFAEALES